METVNVISMYECVYDRYGKKHKVYSVRFKDMQIVTDFTSKYVPANFLTYLMSPVMDENGEVEMINGKPNFDNGFKEDLLEIVECALDYRETREQIEEWLDMTVAENIVQTFLGMSQFKKKQT